LSFSFTDVQLEFVFMSEIEEFRARSGDEALAKKLNRLA